MDLPQVRLALVAGRQGGAFTSAQALAAGYSRDAVRHAVESGRWSKPARGVFHASDLELSVGSLAYTVLSSWVAVLAHRDAVVGYGTAAELHDLATYRPVPGLELVRPKRKGRTPGDHAVTVTVARLPCGQTSEPHGVPATSLERTASDIARRGSLRDGVVVLDSALRRGAGADRVDAVVKTCRGWPGAQGLRLAWSLADVGSESPLESLAHVLHHEQGLPRARTQVELYDERGFIGRVDDYWPQFATVGESDGLAKYDERGSLRAEKLRQERLEQAGLQVVRVTYADVTRDVATTARRYREAFERGLRRLAWRPPSAQPLASPRAWGQEAG